MSVSLTSNFFLNARGLTLGDGGGLVWSFNKNTNTITATGSSGATLSSVGLTSTDLTVSGSPLIANGSITANLVAQAGVAAGSYTYAGLTVNSKGVITAVASGTQPVTSIGSSNLSIGGTTAVPTVNLSTTQVNNIAAGGTALQSLTVADSISGAGTSGSPLELVGDSASPGNSFYYGTNVSGTRGWYASTTVPTAANPAATVGTTAINGSAATFMRSDGAPSLSLTLSPTMTGNWTFAPASGGTTFKGVSGAVALTVTSGNTATGATADVSINRAGSTANALQEGANLTFQDTTAGLAASLQFSGGQTELWQFNGSWGQVWKVLTGHGVQFSGPIGCNGSTPPAQSTGWGTSTNGAVVANYNATAATLLQTADVVAQLITILKANGILGA